MQIEAILCDLDNTIMPEDEANRIAYELASKPAEIEYGVDSNLLGKLAHHYVRALWIIDKSFPYGQTIGCGSTDAITSAFSVSCEGMSVVDLNKHSTMLCRRAWLNALKDVGIEDEKLVDEISGIFPEVRYESYQPYRNVVKTLRKLSSKYPLAIVTNGVEKIQFDKINKCGVDRFADVIVVSERVGIGKPHPLMFETALDRLGISKERVVMVGDSLNGDIKGAKEIGIGQTVWIKDPYAKNVEGIMPDFTIDSLNQLPAILKSINS